MTLEKVIELAIAQGHNIEYVKRKDGGIRVTKVNGKTFRRSSSAGNNAVRAITGGKLSIKQKKALKKNRSKTLSSLLGTKQKKRFQALNKAREAAGLDAITKKQVESVRKRTGKRGVKNLIERGKRTIKYKKDYANTQNIIGFVSQLQDSADVPNAAGETYNFSRLIDLIQCNEDYITETAIRYGYIVMYDWSDGKIEGEYAENIMLVEFRLGIEKLKKIDESLKEI